MTLARRGAHQVFSVVERPKPLYVWGGKFVTAVALITLIGGLLGVNGFERFSGDAALMSMMGMLLVSGIFAGFFKKVAEVDKYYGTVNIQVVMLLKMYSKTYRLSQVGSPKMREEIARTQHGGDLSRVANKSYGTRLFYLVMDRSRLESDKEDLQLKKYFKRDEAESDLRELTQYLN